jgi:3-hydroxyisobutyrate dehydrogenase-like beta-hydroxyacid dehydrogenase
MLKLRALLVLDLPEEALFDVGLMRKDIGLALAMARDLGIRLSSTDAAEGMLTRADELGYEHQDIAALFDASHVPATVPIGAEAEEDEPVRSPRLA